MVASEPIKDLKKLIADKKLGDKITGLGKLSELVQSFENYSSKASDTETKDKEIKSKLDAIAGVLKASKILDQDDVPLTKVTWQKDSFGRASKVTALPLTKHAGNTKGERSKTSGKEKVEGFDLISRWEKKNPAPNRTDSEGKPIYISPVSGTHVLADFLHGPFMPWNIVLSDKSLNENMKNPEGKVHGVLSEKNANSKPGRMSFIVEKIEYHSKNKPPDNGTTPESVGMVKDWVNFYIGQSIKLKINKWDGSKYSHGIYDQSVSGKMIEVKNEPNIKLEDKLFALLSNNLDSDNISRIQQNEIYKKTRFSNHDGLRKAGFQYDDNLILKAVRKLKDSGKIISRRGKNRGYYVKDS